VQDLLVQVKQLLLQAGVVLHLELLPLVVMDVSTPQEQVQLTQILAASELPLHLPVPPAQGQHLRPVVLHPETSAALGLQVQLQAPLSYEAAVEEVAAPASLMVGLEEVVPSALAEPPSAMQALLIQVAAVVAAIRQAAMDLMAL
jgi:hypothetical protein